MSGGVSPARAHANAKAWWESSPRLSQREFAKLHGINEKTFHGQLQIARRDGVIPPAEDRSPEGFSRRFADRWLALPESIRADHQSAADALGMDKDVMRHALTRARRRGILPMSTRHKPGRKIDLQYVLGEWEHLRSGGVSIEEAARRLGTTVSTLQEAS